MNKIMQKMKKVICIILIGAILCLETVLPVYAYESIEKKDIKIVEEEQKTTCVDDFEYSEKNGSIVITGYNGGDTDVIIPAEIDGKIVTRIAVEAFADNDIIESVKIPEGVIGIGSDSFWSCNNLKTVELPFTLKYIESYAFSACRNLENIQLQEGLLEIGYGIFTHCSSLQCIEIPGSVEKIEDGAFSNCESLIEINVSEDNRNYSSENGVLYDKDKDKLLCCPGGKQEYGFISSVTKIEENAFSGCVNLISVEIPNSIKEIKGNTFDGCEKLMTIKISDSVIKIEENAFSGCKSLIEIVVSEDNQNYSSENGVLYDKDKKKILRCPSGKQEYEFLPSVIEIGDAAFSRCFNLESVEIPERITIIGEYAFSECSNLMSIKIPEGVIDIGKSAFSGCSNLEKAELPSGMTNMPDEIFRDCNSLTNIEIPEGVTHIGEFALYGCGNLDNINLPSGITNIEYGAFWGCSNLTEIEIPGEITKLSDYLFAECSNLQNVKISKNVTHIGEMTFLRCYNLTSIEIPESVTEIGKYAFSECYDLVSIEIPSSVIYIGDYAFSMCHGIVIYCVEGSEAHQYAEENEIIFWFGETGITQDFKYCIPEKGEVEITEYTGTEENVIIPSEIEGKQVIKIRENAFRNCKNLKSVKIPSTVTEIGEFVFSGCSNLMSIEIPESVTEIGEFAFSECSKLESVEIPKRLTTIREGVFSGCSNLMSIEIPEGVTEIGEEAFSGCTNLTSIKIPESVVEIGEEAFSGCTNLTSIEIPENVVEIGEEAFSGCTNLTSIEIPEGVTEIGEGVFWGCTNLASIEIPESVTEIGGRAFLGCSNLTSIKIPEGIMDIEYGTFWGCINLTKVEIPEGVTEIGEYAFAECYNLPNIEIPEEVIKIGEGAFSECEKLENISLPESITNIEYGAFQGCSNLTEVEIPEKVTRLSDFLFAECRNLQNVKIPTNVTHIGEWVFYGCEKIESIILPEGLIAIEDWAFRECNNLTEVEIPEGVTEIGEGAFLDCYNLINIKMPVGIEEIKGFAFLGCKKLVKIKIPSSVINIGETPFSECDSLIEIEVSEDNQYYSSENGVLYDKDKKKLICCPIGKQAYELVPSVIEIGEKAFSGCTNLTSIEIPEGVTKIGAYAFLSCEKLESISLPKGIRKVEQGTFRECSNLTEVEIPEGVLEIGEEAFIDCGLKRISLPESIVNIEWGAFLGCSDLTEVEIPSSVIYIGDYAFNECYNMTIYCTDGSTAHQYAIENGIPFILTDASFRVTLSSVVNGTTVSSIANLIGGGVYNKGETVTVTAPEKVGYNFIGWFAKDVAGTTYVVENALSTENTYTFTAADTDLVAVYVPDGKVALTVTDTTNVIIKDTNTDTVLNTGIGVTPGTKITVTYDLQEGEEFLYWKNASGKVVSTDAIHIFTLVNNTTLTPIVKSADAGKLLVEYLNEYNQVLSVEVWTEEGTLSPITPSKLGYICSGWTLELNATETISADKIWEKSADGYVKLYPVYEKVTEEHTITYKNNSAEAIAQTTTVELGATYTVNAEDVAVEGQKFSHWTIGNEIVSYNTSYTFLVTGNITLTAVFVAEETTVEKESILEITSQYEIKNGDTVEKVAFVASREIAEGYTLLEHGMLYAKDSDITDANGFIEGVEGVNKFTASGTGMKGAFTLNVRLGNATSLKVRAYAIVKNNTTGEVTTLYSGMNTYNKNN